MEPAREIQDLYSKVWYSEKSIIILIFRKSSRSDFVDHGGISLVTIASKLLVFVVFLRLNSVRDEQAGWSSNLHSSTVVEALSYPLRTRDQCLPRGKKD